MQDLKSSKEHIETPTFPTTTPPTAHTSQSTMSSQTPNNRPAKLPSPSTTTTKTSLRYRLKHFTFAWYLCTMSTGGLSLALTLTPQQFLGLHTISLVLFFFNITLFLSFSTCMIARAYFHPLHFKSALTNPAESWFIGSFWLSLSVILGGIQVFGSKYEWLKEGVYILYWIYAGLSLVNSIAQYFILIARSRTRPVPFSPAMFLAGYSAMLTGTIASLVAPTQPPARAVNVVYSGLAFQGFGWIISLVCIVYFVRLLLDKGLPPPALRPALFIPVGSVAYTVVAIIGLANAIPDHGYFSQERHPQAKEICVVMALVVSVFMWLFSFWMFAIAVVGNLWEVRKIKFGLSWWAFIFPNVGFMLGTSAIGKELESEGIRWVASAITIGLVAIWLVGAVGCIRAVWTGNIVWPGKDEDKDV
jgi:C4-dicarboxylate transporter/malic acid transport protein